MRLTYSNTLFSLVLCLLFGASCTTRTIFRSPYTNQQNTYHVMPTLSDEKKTAHYLTASATLGGSNDWLADAIYIFQGKYHVAGQLGKNLQGYAGLHGSVGSYDISGGAYDNNVKYDPVTGEPIYFEGPTGNKFTASVGSTAGLAIVIPLGTRVEWRVFGLESSFGREFGDYYKTRLALPDSVVEISDRRNTHLTLGGFTEWIFKPRNPDVRLGYQLAIGSSLHRLRNYEQFTYNNFTPFYINNTFHFTVRRTTGFVRLSAGNFYGAVQSGVSFRLN
ncbi:MAG: hypothetical protein KAF40_11655 [Flavihumibacter sp.]|nr:hypothetical protein [Flavihumibacter sp.]